MTSAVGLVEKLWGAYAQLSYTAQLREGDYVAVRITSATARNTRFPASCP